MQTRGRKRRHDLEQSKSPRIVSLLLLPTHCRTPGTTTREEIGEDSAADSCPRHGFLWGESLQHINGHCSESLRICLDPRLGRRS